MNTFILWILLRILTSLFAAIVSSIRPLLPVEKLLPLFPPGVPVVQWLERVFLSPWLRWDSDWYVRIVTQGYSPMDGTAQFHPLYSWLATPLARIGVHPVLSLLIISSLAGIALFFFFVRLADLDYSPDTAFYALMLFSFAPLSFVLFAPYPEALFLLLSVLCLFFSRQKKWWLAGLTGGLATLTRQQGIFLLVPLAWELWEDNARKPGNMIRQWRHWSAILLVPLGFILWILYRAFFLYDLHIDWSNFQQFIYSFLISSSSSKVVEVQQFVWPWQAIYFSLSKLITYPDLDLWLNIVTAALFMVMFAFAWKKIRPSYRLYSLVIVLISFSYYTGPVHPYMGLPRHMYLAFPIFMGFAARITKPWLRLIFISFSAVWMIFLLVQFVLQAWVP